MSTLVVIMIFAASTYFAWTRGVGYVFSLVYIPVIVLLSATKSIALPLLPDMTSQFAVGYGALAGLVLRGGEKFNIRWNIFDSLMIALWLVGAAAAGVTDGMEMARNSIGDGFFDFLTPYFLARIAFQSAGARRAAFWSTIVCAGLVTLMSPIEMRLQPQIFSRVLDGLGLFTPANSMTLYRFGLARAQTTFWQPMDQGNCGIMLAGIIGICACTTSIGLRDWRALAGIGMGCFVSMASLSFSSFLNVAMATGLFFALKTIPDLGRVLLVFVVIGVLGGAGVTNHLLNRELGEREDNLGQTMDDSLFMRTKIVQESWPIVTSAGWVGYGKDGVERELKTRSPDKDYVKSIDNTYLLMVMQRGWPYFILFMSIPILVSIRTASSFCIAAAESQRMPVNFAVAVIFTVMVAMYTIFFGFVYSHLWLVMLGLFSSMTDVLLGRVLLESERPISEISLAQMNQPSAFPAIARGS